MASSSICKVKFPMKVVVPFVCIGLANIEGSVEILAKFSEMFD